MEFIFFFFLSHILRQRYICVKLFWISLRLAGFILWLTCSTLCWTWNHRRGRASVSRKEPQFLVFHWRDPPLSVRLFHSLSVSIPSARCVYSLDVESLSFLIFVLSLTSLYYITTLLLHYVAVHSFFFRNLFIESKI